MVFLFYFDMCLFVKDIEGRKFFIIKNENMKVFIDVLL